MVLPPGHVTVHQGDEPGIVGGLQQVNQFVDHKVFEALRRLLRQVSIETNRARLVGQLLSSISHTFIS